MAKSYNQKSIIGRKQKALYLLTNDSASKVYAAIISIVLGLLFGFIIMLIANSNNALRGFSTILQGGINISGINANQSYGQMLYHAAPIMLTGLAVGFAFRTGMFNIGASGQFLIGATLSLYVIFTWTAIPISYRWVFGILAGMIGGGLWALLPAIFKAFFNVHEVISTIMMNYIGLYLVNMIVPNMILYDSATNRTRALPNGSAIPRFGLDKIFPDSSVNIGIIIAILISIIIYLLLNKTTIGYELKACGFNKSASQYAGINIKKNIILAMVISGALAGISGALVYLADTGMSLNIVDVLPNEGFEGITVALLGMSNPLAIILSALFISYIYQGGFYMLLYDFSPEIIDIITSVIIYVSSFTMFITFYIRKKSLKLDKSNINAENSDISIINNHIEDTSNLENVEKRLIEVVDDKGEVH